MGNWLRFDPAALVGLAYAGLLSALPIRLLADRQGERRLIRIAVVLVRASAVLMAASLAWMCVVQGAWSGGSAGAAATSPFSTPAGWLLGVATAELLGALVLVPSLRPRSASVAAMLLALALATPCVLGLPVAGTLLPEEVGALGALRTLLTLCGAGLLALAVPLLLDASTSAGRAGEWALRATCGFLVAGGLASALWAGLAWGTAWRADPRPLTYAAATVLCIAAVHSQAEGRRRLTQAAAMLALMLFVAAAAGAGTLAGWTGATGAYW